LGSLAKQESLLGGLSHFTKGCPGNFLITMRPTITWGVAKTRLGHMDEAMQAFQKGRRCELAEGTHWQSFGVGYLLYLEGKPRGGSNHPSAGGLELDESSPDGYLILGDWCYLRLNIARTKRKEARVRLFSASPISPRPIWCFSDACGHRHEYREQTARSGCLPENLSRMEQRVNTSAKRARWF